MHTLPSTRTVYLVQTSAEETNAGARVTWLAAHGTVPVSDLSIPRPIGHYSAFLNENIPGLTREKATYKYSAPQRMNMTKRRCVSGELSHQPATVFEI